MINPISSPLLMSSFYSIKPDSPKKSFCQKAYDEQIVTEKEVENAIKTNEVVTKKEVKKQGESLLEAIPVEIKEYIFSFLSEKDLKNCLTSCGQLYRIVSPFFANQVISSSSISEDFTNISKDFKWVENQINVKLGDIKPINLGSFGGRKIVPISTKPLMDQIREFEKESTQITTGNGKISSFKAYCIFLVSHADKDKDLTQINRVLTSVLQLEKACNHLLREKQEAIKTQVKMRDQTFIINWHNSTQKESDLYSA